MGNVCVNTFRTFNKNIYLRNVYAMDRYENRRLQLKAAVDAEGRGGIAKISRKCDIDSTYLSRLLYPEGKSGKKRIGEDIKEKIENNLGNIFQEQNKIDVPAIKSSLNSLQIPLMNVTASMGNGEHQYGHEIVIDVLRVSKIWVEKTLSPISHISNLSFIHAIGDSMLPTFNDGDILLVDSGSNNVSSDSVYVLEAHDRLFIKRVRRRMDGNFEISSDNPAVKTVDVLNGEHEVIIKGRVVWVWNGKKV